MYYLYFWNREKIILFACVYLYVFMYISVFLYGSLPVFLEFDTHDRPRGRDIVENSLWCQNTKKLLDVEFSSLRKCRKSEKSNRDLSSCTVVDNELKFCRQVSINKLHFCEKYQVFFKSNRSQKN